MKVSRQDTVETNGNVKEGVPESVAFLTEVFPHPTNEFADVFHQFIYIECGDLKIIHTKQYE